MFKILFRPKYKTPNGRRFKRMHLAYLVKYQVNGQGEPRITNARDISAGGLRFWTSEKLPESAVLHISIFIPPLGRSVKAVARVLRVRRVKRGFTYSVAVSFVDLIHEDREAIEQFAESISKEQDARFVIDQAKVIVRRE